MSCWMSLVSLFSISESYYTCSCSFHFRFVMLFSVRPYLFLIAYFSFILYSFLTRRSSPFRVFSLSHLGRFSSYFVSLRFYFVAFRSLLTLYLSDFVAVLVSCSVLDISSALILALFKLLLVQFFYSFRLFPSIFAFILVSYTHHSSKRFHLPESFSPSIDFWP